MQENDFSSLSGYKREMSEKKGFEVTPAAHSGWSGMGGRGDCSYVRM